MYGHCGKAEEASCGGVHNFETTLRGHACSVGDYTVNKSTPRQRQKELEADLDEYWKRKIFEIEMSKRYPGEKHILILDNCIKKEACPAQLKFFFPPKPLQENNLLIRGSHRPILQKRNRSQTVATRQARTHPYNKLSTPCSSPYHSSAMSYVRCT